MAQHLFGIQQDGKVRVLAVRLAVDGFVRAGGGAAVDQDCWTFSTFSFCLFAFCLRCSYPAIPTDLIRVPDG